MGAFLAGLLAAAKAKAAGLALGAGVAGLVALLVKVAPGYLAKQVGASLDKSLNLSNPSDREFAMAVVKWVETKIPDRGMGGERYKLAASKLVAMFPVLASQQDSIRILIEEAVNRMDEELKKRGGAA